MDGWWVIEMVGGNGGGGGVGLLKQASDVLRC
jgi:hypothetical protein